MIDLPAPVVETRDDGLMVVRDDLLPGGTKRRVLPSLMVEWPEDEFVYAGPASGFAQVAGAYAARDVGKRWTVFIAKRKVLHPLTVEAVEAGAQVVQVPHGRLNVVQSKARAYCSMSGARYLPLGFDLPEFVTRLTAVARGLDVAPAEVWCVAGSGTLTRALQAAWPSAAHHAVQVGQPPSTGAACLHRAPEAFSEAAAAPPPFPSCPNYDAKAWQFLEGHHGPGTLFWNVA